MCSIYTPKQLPRIKLLKQSTLVPSLVGKSWRRSIGRRLETKASCKHKYAEHSALIKNLCMLEQDFNILCTVFRVQSKNLLGRTIFVQKVNPYSVVEFKKKSIIQSDTNISRLPLY